ncbi:MAG: hypothetical protein SNJ76_09775 [Fimbriimonadaceae bacterium]
MVISGETLNRMLDGRIADLAAGSGPISPKELGGRQEAAKTRLQKALGLYPMPPRTDLQARSAVTLAFEEYRVETVRYDSRPGWTVTANLYRPLGAGPFPAVVLTAGETAGKKSAPYVQARGIGLALRGYAALVVDSPGPLPDGQVPNERSQAGDPDDLWLTMGCPALGAFAFDLIRAADWLETQSDLDTKKLAVVGEGYGSAAAAVAFGIDDRFGALAVHAWGGSLADDREETGMDRIPGVFLLGDRADMLSIRAPAPMLLMAAVEDHRCPIEGVRITAEKLDRQYRALKAEHQFRFESFEMPRDFNRRMRECLHAFLDEHLRGFPRRAWVAEPRPLTDGATNDFPAGTLAADAPELQVSPESPIPTRTFRDLLDQSLAEPHPEAIDAMSRLAPWLRYAQLQLGDVGTTLRIHDPGTPQVAKDSLEVPIEAIDPRKPISLGISVAEFVAQVLFLSVPGGPEGWESRAFGADALTSMIASVKTFVGGGHDKPVLSEIEAHGPVSSQIAWFFRLYRPDVVVRASHPPFDWSVSAAPTPTALIQPMARYLKPIPKDAATG